MKIDGTAQPRAPRIDSHQHFWRYNDQEYTWMTMRMASLKRDYLPDELGPQLRQMDFDGSIAVQARQTLKETRWLLDLARTNSIICGVVGWVDLRAESITDCLSAFSTSDKLVGVRHVVHDEPDDQFLLQPDFLRGIAALKQFDLAYDLLLYPRHLGPALELVRMFPGQRFVIDHAAKPEIAKGVMSPWRDSLREIAARPRRTGRGTTLTLAAPWHRKTARRKAGLFVRRASALGCASDILLSRLPGGHS